MSVLIRETLHFDRPVSPLFESTILAAVRRGFKTSLEARLGAGHAVDTRVVDHYVYTACLDANALLAPKGPSKPRPAGDVNALAELWERETIPEVQALLRELRSLVSVDGPAEAAAADVARIQAIFDRLYEIHYDVAGWMGQSMLIFSSMLRGVGEKNPEMTAALLLAPSESRLREVDAWIAAVAGLAADSPDLAPRLRGDARALIEALRLDNGDAGREFRRLWPEVSARPANVDLRDPTWGEDPTSLALALAQGRDASDAHDAAIARARAKAREHAAAILARLPPGSDKSLDALVAMMRRVRRLAETENYLVGEIASGLARLAFLRAGDRLANAGALRARDDVTLLTLAEIEEALRGRPVAPELVEARRRSLEAAARASPPDVIGDVPPALEASPLFAGLFGGRKVATRGATSLDGVAASPGVARARARLVRAEEDLDHVKKGEALVVMNLAPAWTAVTSRVAAIVAETGGMLAHAAVVAREAGIPAVVGAGGATSAIETGDLIEVDGEKGVVRIYRE